MCLLFVNATDTKKLEKRSRPNNFAGFCYTNYKNWCQKIYQRRQSSLNVNLNICFDFKQVSTFSWTRNMTPNAAENTTQAHFKYFTQPRRILNCSKRNHLKKEISTRYLVPHYPFNPLRTLTTPVQICTCHSAPKRGQKSRPEPRFWSIFAHYTIQKPLSLNLMCFVPILPNRNLNL